MNCSKIVRTCVVTLSILLLHSAVCAMSDDEGVPREQRDAIAANILNLEKGAVSTYYKIRDLRFAIFGDLSKPVQDESDAAQEKNDVPKAIELVSMVNLMELERNIAEAQNRFDAAERSIFGIRSLLLVKQSEGDNAGEEFTQLAKYLCPDDKTSSKNDQAPVSSSSSDVGFVHPYTAFGPPLNP